jgi:hypothetical protein
MMTTTTSSDICRIRIAAFEQAALDATDPKIMASQISSKSSDRKKYDFRSGLQRDLLKTRAALRQCVRNKQFEFCSSCTTFGQLFEHTEGQIANLNRVLQNLKRVEEIDFDPELFLVGVNDDQTIQLKQRFWKEEYIVDSENVFQRRYLEQDHRIANEDSTSPRKGRSYIDENLATMRQKYCAACHEFVDELDRLTIRSLVYHSKCLTCTVCGSSPRQRLDYMTFDGNICCGHGCVRQYDGAHIRQQRS